METLAGWRVVGIALGYEDLNDHDRLRFDPVIEGVVGQAEGAAVGLRAGRGGVDVGPAGVGRGEGALAHRRTAHDGAAIKHLLVELFVEARARSPGDCSRSR